MTLWYLEVVLVVYANLARSSTGEISCLKWHNTHAQLSTWYGSANHSGNKENKHDKVTFQLAAVDLNSSTLMIWNLCDRHILKDNSWMCILYHYLKASRLKSCTAMCLGARGEWGKYISCIMFFLTNCATVCLFLQYTI